MAAMDVEFALSQQLEGHTSQVRCVCVLPTGALVTGGLDACVIVWTPSEARKGGFALDKRLGHHSDFILAVSPSHSDPGAFYTASKDRTAVKVDADGNPVQQFTGHEGAVCSVLERGAQVITGSWDGTAKVWDCASGELRHTLEAGSHAVALGVLPTGELVTGSQDKTLRVWRGGDLVSKVDDAHGDVIRCITASASHLVTCSNDMMLKMWSFDGIEMGVISGHTSFVYHVTHSIDGNQLISSSDDCTVKLWSLSDLSCSQSLLHAATVWQAGTLANGDIASACEDSIVRVWTVDPERMAPEAERQTQKEIAENAAVQARAKGSDSTPVPDAQDISEMPTTVGKKNGEIKCFKEGAVTSAYSWNAGNQAWDCIGEVVGSPDAGKKSAYKGDACFPAGEYDFVFDVDMGGGSGTQPLPYNRGGNPMLAAEAFCAREQIRKENAEQIRLFIEQHAGDGGGAPTIGGSASGSSSSLFPVTTPMSLKEGKFEGIQTKILEFNGVVEEGLRLNPDEVQFLTEAIAKLKSGDLHATFRACEKDVINVKLGAWPAANIFPVLDLWRLYLLHPECTDTFKGSDRGTKVIKQVVDFVTADANGPVGLCGARYLANLFDMPTCRSAVFDKRLLVLPAIEPALVARGKHTRLAAATVLLNFAVALTEACHGKPWDQEFAGGLARLCMGVLSRDGPDEAEPHKRAIMCLGTLLVRDGGGVKEICKGAGLPTRLMGTDLPKEVGRVVSIEVAKLIG